MDTLDTLIIGGTVVTPHSTQKLNIGISNGILCELLNPSITPKAQTIIDASGKFIIPGCIDEHIHFNDPGTTYLLFFPRYGLGKRWHTLQKHEAVGRSQRNYDYPLREP